MVEAFNHVAAGRTDGWLCLNWATVLVRRTATLTLLSFLSSCYWMQLLTMKLVMTLFVWTRPVLRLIMILARGLRFSNL